MSAKIKGRVLSKGGYPAAATLYVRPVADSPSALGDYTVVAGGVSAETDCRTGGVGARVQAGRMAVRYFLLSLWDCR